MIGAYIVIGPIGPIVATIWGYVVDVDVLAPADVTMSSMCHFGIRVERVCLAIYL